MKSLFILVAAIVSVSSAQAQPKEPVYTCGDLYISGRCDDIECLVSLKVTDLAGRNNFIFINTLDGQPVGTKQEVLKAGIVKKVGEFICVTGDVVNDDTIPSAETAILN